MCSSPCKKLLEKDLMLKTFDQISGSDSNHCCVSFIESISRGKVIVVSTELPCHETTEIMCFTCDRVRLTGNTKMFPINFI